jgi:hypothetical protein
MATTTEHTTETISTSYQHDNEVVSLLRLNDVKKLVLENKDIPNTNKNEVFSKLVEETVALHKPTQCPPERILYDEMQVKERLQYWVSNLKLLKR